MKKIITEEEKDNFCIGVYDKVSNLKNERKNLTDEYYGAVEKMNNLSSDYQKLKIEYNEILLLEIGKGKFYNKKIKPIQIEQRINSLEADIFDHYTGKKNDNIKEIESLIPVLKEDLETAKKELEELEQYIVQITDEFFKVKEEYNESKKQVRLLERKMLLISKKIDILLKAIRKVDSAYEESKKIDIEKVKLSLKK